MVQLLIMKKNRFLITSPFIILLLVFSFLPNNLFAKMENYFTKPLNIVVTFGQGGGTDRMTRIMAKYIEEAIEQPVNIINKKGEGTHLALEYFLSKEQDGHTILASAFPFYLINSINTKRTKYKIEDFSMINLQWFDYDYLVVRKSSTISNLTQLVKKIKTKSSEVIGGVIFNSSGHLMLKVILEKLNIRQDELHIKYYNDGESVRTALLKKEVDFIISPAKGAIEDFKKSIKPIFVIKVKRARKWDAPTLNEELRKYGVELPTLTGSMRGFAVSSNFKEKYPNRYEYLVNIFRNLLAKKKVQNELRGDNIGYTWIGPKKANKIVKKTNIFCNEYQYLIQEEDDE